MSEDRPNGAASHDLPPSLVSAPSVRPRSVGEIRETLDRAAADGGRVLVVGTGLDLRPLPADLEPTLLRTKGLSGIEAYEPADLTLTAGAGTTLAEIESVLAEHGQWLPVDPPRASQRTLGGLVATGAASPLSTWYGAPRDHVLGLTLVTGDGAELHLGGRVMKNVAGFDLVRLVVGSRGSLGVVTSATVRVFPRPAVDRLHVREGPMDEVLNLGPAVASAPLLPASAVIVSDGPDRARLVLRLHGAEAAVGADAKAFERHLGVAFDGTDPGGSSGAGKRAGLEERAGMGERPRSKERAGMGERPRGEERASGGERADGGRGALADGGGASRSGAVVRDAADSGSLAVRASALPSDFPEVWYILHEALPDATLAADPLAGRLRASTDAAVDADTLRRVRSRLEALGGSLVLRRAPAELAATVGVHGAGGPARAMSRALVERFDARGVLAGGRWSAVRPPERPAGKDGG